MTRNDIIKNKSNVFDHILYEFEMYIQTFNELVKLFQQDSENQFMENVLLESHAVHLRNLIEFFNCEKNCITTATVFVGEHDLSYDDTSIKAKQTVSKTIDHLTKERYTWNQTENDLTIRYNDVIQEMYNKYMVFRIQSCVDLMIKGTDVQPRFLADLHDSGIQQRLLQLKNTCSINSKVPT